jgi:hypothetical protein
LSCVAAVSSLGRFGARLACLVFWGFLAETGQTGVLHRSDRCGAFLWKSPSFTNGDRSDRCWSVDSRFGVPLRSRVRMLCVGSEVQWHSSGYVGLANLGSESETCVGSRVHFVGVSISFEKNFYRLPFTPPLSGSPYQSFKWYQSRFRSLLTLTSLRSKDGIPGSGFGSSTLRWQELRDVE